MVWSQLSAVEVAAQHLTGETSSRVASPKNNSSFSLMYVHRQNFVKSVFFLYFPEWQLNFMSKMQNVKISAVQTSSVLESCSPAQACSFPGQLNPYLRQSVAR